MNAPATATVRRTLDTGTEYLLGYVEDRVAVLSLNQPDRRNALRTEMYDGFSAVLPGLSADPEVGCIVVTGEGGAFCAGGDVKGFNENNQRGPSSGAVSREAKVDDLRRRMNSVSRALYESPKITIAAIPGAAAGAGLSIALACDLRVATEKAIITTAFAKIGASGDFGGSWFLSQLVGHAKAMELYLLSDRVPAAEAERLGIVNRVFADADYEAGWQAFARRIANGPVVAHRYIKENLHRALGSDLATCLDAEAPAMVITMSTEDHREAAAAFVEKRDAVFHGR